MKGIVSKAPLAIVVGSNRFGASIARSLEHRGYDVAVVDSDPRTHERMERDFAGLTCKGDPTDRDVLETCRIEKASAVVVALPSDETAYFVARIARTVYQVPDVVACLSPGSRLAELDADGIRFVRAGGACPDLVLDGLGTVDSGRLDTPRTVVV